MIGRDTRESGAWIEDELARGLSAEGATVVSAGVVPTPAIAYLARTEGFRCRDRDFGSHNPYEDNGIKVFGGSGTKLTEQLESPSSRSSPTSRGASAAIAKTARRTPAHRDIWLGTTSNTCSRS